MTAAGDVGDFDADAQLSLVASMADLLGVAVVDVSLSISAGSVRLVFSVTVADSAAAAAVSATVASMLPTATAASSALGVPVLTVPTATTLDVSPPLSPPPPVPSSHSPPALSSGPSEAPPRQPSPSSPTEPQPPSQPGIGSNEEGVSSSDAAVTIAVPLAVATLVVLVAAVILLRRSRRRALKKSSQQRRSLQLAAAGLKRGSSSWKRARQTVGNLSFCSRTRKLPFAAEKVTSHGHVTVSVLGEMSAASASSSTDRRQSEAGVHTVGATAGAHHHGCLTSFDPFESPRGTCTVAPVITPESNAELTDVEVPIRQNTFVTFEVAAEDAALSAPGPPPTLQMAPVSVSTQAHAVLVEEVTLVVSSSAEALAAVEVAAHACGPDANAPACAIGQVLSQPRI